MWQKDFVDSLSDIEFELLYKQCVKRSIKKIRESVKIEDIDFPAHVHQLCERGLLVLAIQSLQSHYLVTGKQISVAVAHEACNRLIAQKLLR